VQGQPTNPKGGTAGVGLLLLLGAAGFLAWRIVAAAIGGPC